MNTIQEEMETRIDSLVARIEAHQAKTKAKHEELIAAMKTSQETIEFLMDVSM
jgi:hypothetical protein